jgi:RND family efflux transporter MFP subunit
MNQPTNAPTDPPPPPARSGGRNLVDLLVRAGLPVGLLAASVLAFLFLAREPERAKAPPAKAQPIRTKIVELRVREYPVVIKTHGIVQPHHEITMSAQVSGRIERLSPKFEDGAFFSTGDVLVELEADDYRTAAAVAEARLLGAEAALALATVNHGRNTKSFEENLIAKTEVDLTAANLKQATAEVNAAKAQLERAERDLERTRIRAPFDGRVRTREVGLGQLVGTSTPLGTVFAVDYAEVRLPIAGRELPFLELPDSPDDPQVEVELRNAIDLTSTITWRGRIIRTEGALDENSLELFAIARVNDPFGLQSGHPPLRIGQPVVASIAGRMLQDVVALPRVAVRQLDQIFLVDRTGLTLSARTVVPVWEDKENIIVRDPAIVDGSWLATTHLVYAPDGARVEIIPDIEAPPATAASATSNEVINTKPSVSSTDSNKKS